MKNLAIPVKKTGSDGGGGSCSDSSEKHSKNDSEVSVCNNLKTDQSTDEKENVDNAETPPKVNAFQFMMNSRHKTIGRNSPGKEVQTNELTDDALSKLELKARKSRLESWSERRGAAKRKREYEEVGNCINYKLEKREKKMKKMLKIDCQSDDEVITRKQRKCIVIDTDSDNSDDVPLDKRKSKSRLSLNKKEKKNKCENEEKSLLTPKTVKSWKLKIKLRLEDNGECEEVHEKTTSSHEEPEATVTASKEESLKTVTANEKVSQNVVSEKSKTVSSEMVTSTESEIIEDAVRVENEKVNSPERKIETQDIPSNECNLVETNTESLNEEKRVLRARKPKPKMYQDFVMSDSEDENKSRKKRREKKENEKKNVKVAPVFLKAVPKPKVDPKVLEARRQFLLSGVPSSLKKEMEKQQCAEDIEFDVFPTISHVQQKSTNDIVWDLPKAELNLKHCEISKIAVPPFSKELLNLQIPEQTIKEEPVVPSRLTNCRNIIRDIKSRNPDYPVYKVFNSIFSKSGYKPTDAIPINEKSKITPKQRGRPKKKVPNKSKEINDSPPVKLQDKNNILAAWTEKYKPNVSTDVIGNHSSVSSLHEWLTNWQKIKRRKTSDSESEFDITDGDSRDSTKMCGSTIMLKGPTGSGKTAAVYAVCNELGFSVLEVNASSRRTGKKLLQELQEATQSHQVRKKENNLSSFTKEIKKEEKTKHKMCILLVEDVDIVFEQDEGFTAALSQIMMTSKRPIILTTTDEPSNTIQRIISDSPVISFLPLSPILTVWLQIVCLVEGYYVHPKSLEELLNYNRGDIRRTLLQLQLFVNSGGQLHKNEIKNETITETAHDEMNVKIEDDNSNLSDLKLDESESKENVQIHYNCLSGSLPTHHDIGVIWWNLPRILNLPDLANLRLDRTSFHALEVQKTSKEKMKALYECYESFSFADVISGKNQFHESLGRRWRLSCKDGLGLEENMASYKDHVFSRDLAQTLLFTRTNLFSEKFEDTSSSLKSLNMAVPGIPERRWRAKQLSCEEKLQEALLPSEFLERKSVALDYMPSLRTMARSEFQRAASNTKRGNRFYNYLRNLGIRLGDNTYKIACDVFKI